MDSFHNTLTDNLMDEIVKLKNKDSAYKLFEDLCTIKEIQEMSKRLEAAKLLSKDFKYDEIVKKIGISSATLSRVSRALKYGSGGYEKIVKNLK